MKLSLNNLKIFKENTFINDNITLNASITKDICSNCFDFKNDLNIFFTDNIYAFPGFIDVHVHLREPGFSYKETIKTGTLAAAKGGYTTVCTMPNLNPVPDSLENLKVQTDIIKKDAVIEVIPYGSITKGEKGEKLSDMESLASKVVGFSDDGICVQNENLIEKAMLKAKKLDKIIAAHCECEKLANNGYIHQGDYAKKHGHKGLSSESEYKIIERDINLARKTGAKYHISHLSCKESVELVRKAKKEGLKITSEATAHHIALDDTMLKEDGIYKMYPPIRSKEDRLAVIEGIKDGTIDLIASDHAPHSKEEKSKGLKDSAKGMVGLETTFSILHAKLVKTGIINLEKLIELVYINPKKIFKVGNEFKDETYPTFTIWNMDYKHKVDAKKFLSKAKFSPFDEEKIFSKCLLTVYKGKIVYIDEDIKNFIKE